MKVKYEAIEGGDGIEVNQMEVDNNRVDFMLEIDEWILQLLLPCCL